MTYLVTVINIDEEAKLILAEDLLALINLLSLVELSEIYEVADIQTTEELQDYTDFINELYKTNKPDGMNFG